VHGPTCRWTLAVLLLLVISGTAAAQANRVKVSGNPGTLRISSAVAGLQPTPVSDALTTYMVKVASGGPRKITAQLDIPMPAGVTLTMALAAPAGATSLGAVSLDATPRDLVVNIPVGTNATQSITFQLDATVLAGVVPASTRNVTLTLANYP